MARIYRKGRDGIYFAWWFEGERRVARSTGTKRKRDAQRIGDELERAARAQADQAAHRDATLGWVMMRLVESLRMGGRAPSTIINTATKSRHVVTHFGADLPISSFEPPEGITRLREYVAERVKQGAARSTISIEVNVLKMALNLAAREGRFRGNTRALSVAELRGAHKPRRQWLTATEAKALIAETPAQWRDHVETYIGLGVRRMELYRIEARDLDLKANRVHVRGTKTERSDRWLPLSPRVRKILSARAKARPEGRLFPEWTRAHLDLPEICQRAELPPTTVSDLRRTFASLMLSAGVSSSVLKELMGHTTTKQIDLVYGHATEEARQSAVAMHPLAGRRKRGSGAVAAKTKTRATGGTDGTRSRPKKRARSQTS